MSFDGKNPDGMDIVRLDADDLERVQGAVALENAVRAVDSPWVHDSTVRVLQGRIRYGWDLEPGEYFVGLEGGRVVALGVVETSEWDNLDLAWLDLVVHPEHRRHRLGTRMYEHLVERAVGMGRTKLGCDCWDGTPGEEFGKEHGLKRASQAINRRQHLDELSFKTVQNLYDEAARASAAYELVRVVGRTPEELLPAVAEMTAAINDAPLDDLDIEDEVFSTERVANYETATLARGHRLYRLIAAVRDRGARRPHRRRGRRGRPEDRASARHLGGPCAPRSPSRPAPEKCDEPVAGRR